MPDCIIQGTNLGKRYELGHIRQDTLRDSLANKARNLFKRGGPGGRTSIEEFWALREVSFTINRGDVVGIIGRNGAGKSTLLKVLSRITEPTTGSIRLRGRIASLLEVGTGFHPELSGRENIYLNGAILGMTRIEIQRKFDEIVAFAEVERFLDTPVKHYSSGMYVRLAFAVAAHLEPEILIVDEVLAVGDAQFQKKCLGKMQSVASQEGRTVLLVSHNMSVIQSLCNRALLLEDGRLVHDGEPASAVARYLANSSGTSFQRAVVAGARCTITSGEVRLVPGEGGPWVEVRANVECLTPVRAAFEFRLLDPQGQPCAFGSFGTFEPDRMISFVPGPNPVACRFSVANFANGRYGLTLKLALPFVEGIDEVAQALAFDLEAPPGPGSSHRLLHAWGCGAFLLDLR
jgi:lipopolysaccharide transport system ATP-binding protein